MKTPVLALLAFVVATVALAQPATAPDLTAHVQRVAERVGTHLPRTSALPDVAVVERAAIAAGVEDGRLVVTTALLAALHDDAQLALVLGYEQARIPHAVRRGAVHSGGGRGVGTSVARSVAVGAAASAVAVEVAHALEGSGRTVRAAATGGAAGGTAALVSTSFPRRSNRDAARADDSAAEEGMGAVIAAGYDGAAAQSAWDALSLASVGSADDGSLADDGANRRRETVTARVLRRAGSPAPGSGHAVGRDPYRTEVLDRLAGWRVRGSGPASQEPVATTPSPLPELTGPRAWLEYERSGGISGEVARVRVEADGSVSATSSRRGSAQPRKLSAQDLETLRRRVSEALVLPARLGKPDLKYFRDGMSRQLVVNDRGAVQTIQLSDGHELTPSDWELIRQLEAWIHG